VLGALLGWYIHSFEVVGVQSQWQSGLFNATPVTLAAWALFALVLGTFLGALIGRTVTAMAATAVGGVASSPRQTWTSSTGCSASLRSLHRGYHQ